MDPHSFLPSKAVLGAPAHRKFNFVLESEGPIMITQWQGVCVSSPTLWDVWEGQVWRSCARWWEGRHSPHYRWQAAWPLRWRDTRSSLTGDNQHLQHQADPSLCILQEAFWKKKTWQVHLDRFEASWAHFTTSGSWVIQCLKKFWSIALSSQRTLAFLYGHLPNTWSPA